MEVAVWFLLWEFGPSVASRIFPTKTSSSPSSSSARGRPATMTKVFGQEREIDIPAEVFPSDEELLKMESAMPGCEHDWFGSVYEGAKLHYRKWLPSGGKKPKAIIIFNHGIMTHSGNSGILSSKRKVNLSLQMDAWLREGCALYACDRYGHGYSEGTRWYIPEKWENDMADVIAFVKLVASMHDDDVPIFLEGESYGGCLTIHVAKHFQEHPASAPKNFDSIMLIAPAIVGDLPPAPVVFFLRYGLAPWFPKWQPFFMPNPLPPDRIWRDPEVLALRTDKRAMEMMVDGSGNKYRLGTGVGLLLALEESRKTAIPGFTVPYCIVHGTQDEGVPIDGSEYMWNTADTPGSDRAFHRLEGAYHDLLSDPTSEECMQYLVDWVKKRVAARTK